VDNKKFVFPQAILGQINECSNGGYILFSLDTDGLPQVHSDFDNPTYAMALQYYIENWGKAVEGLNIELTARSFDLSENLDPEDDPEEREPEEGDDFA
jgi:hypothetical protein